MICIVESPYNIYSIIKFFWFFNEFCGFLTFAGATPCGCPFHRKVSNRGLPFLQEGKHRGLPLHSDISTKILEEPFILKKAKFSISKRFGKNLSDGSVRIGKSEPTGGIWQSGGSVLDLLKFFEKNLAFYLSKT